jgi:hypothetical protein
VVVKRESSECPVQTSTKDPPHPKVSVRPPIDLDLNWLLSHVDGSTYRHVCVCVCECVCAAQMYAHACMCRHACLFCIVFAFDFTRTHTRTHTHSLVRRCQFEIDRSKQTCKTPRRNGDVAEALVYADAARVWFDRVVKYFRTHVFQIQKKHDLNLR